jgi:hypothetical protein
LRLGRRSSAGLSLTLGVLVGLALVILPGVLTPSTQNSTTGLNYFGRIPSILSTQSGTLNNQPTVASTGATVGSLLILVILILFPAFSLSVVARYWTLKRAKAGLASEEISS